jgi:hypothetical protein
MPFLLDFSPDRLGNNMLRLSSGYLGLYSLFRIHGMT